MNTSAQLSKHFHDVHFGGNWTCSNLKDQLADVTWEQALTQVYDLNTIATLTFHMNYFVEVAMRVLEGGPLEGKDALSFAHPPIASQEDWEQLRTKALIDAERFTALIAAIPEEWLYADFTDQKYGSYFRNMLGIIEHTHYHLGQIAVVKKIVKAKEAK